MTQVAVTFGRDADVPASHFQASGLLPYTTLAWPGHRCAVIQAQGCPWRCTYCFRPELQDAAQPGTLAWDTIMAHLHSQTHAIDAVVFSGGEPTRQLALLPAMREAKELGLAVGLESAGAFPGRLHHALQLADWLALDLKAMPEGYHDITSKPAAGSKAWASLEIALAWGGPLELRLTVDPTTHTREAVLSVIHRARIMGGPTPVLQEASGEGCTDEYRSALAGRRITDVLTPADLEGLVVRR